MAIDGIGGADLDKVKRNWRTETLQEIQKNMDDVEEQDPAVARWAREMAAATNVADTVTYQMLDGGIDFTQELDNITNDNMAINELPESGQAATAEAVQNPPEAEQEQANPELGPEDSVQPEVNTIVPPQGEEVAEEEKPEEIKPEKEEEKRLEEEMLNPDANLGSEDLKMEARKRKRGEL